MAKSNTTNVAYYFARRKDTGMTGVWYTHCANERHKLNILNRLINRATALNDMVILSAGDIHSTRFRVKFLEEHFTAVISGYCQSLGISFALDLHMQVLREAGYNIEQMP